MIKIGVCYISSEVGDKYGDDIPDNQVISLKC